MTNVVRRQVGKKLVRVTEDDYVAISLQLYAVRFNRHLNLALILCLTGHNRVICQFARSTFTERPAMKNHWQLAL